MTVQALFDEGRRKEIRDALKTGRSIRFRDSKAGLNGKPEPDRIPEISQEPDVIGFDIRFDRLLPDGAAYLFVNMKSGDSMIFGPIQVEDENIVKLPDGKKVRIPPARPDASLNQGAGMAAGQLE